MNEIKLVKYSYHSNDRLFLLPKEKELAYAI